ncbi:hypothetical protein BGP78_02950 [Pseudoalteromonas sp. MSK9-3]|uniref:hypothetical protein n=1 Tax=Pseudoalteromonas sp. MSK9-3 TaxID=1897633 RepID=UPI000E6C2CDF|nr:hypothetical protein [Pseudoalteromonas sp. MSK9-3]RJE75696.1 hypothetical protein BGP78_02950 [Pseudoalteromonas sp. MSK9-3]
MLANKKSLLALSVTAALTLTGCFSDDDNNVVVQPVEPTDPVVVAPTTPDALGLVVSGSVVNAANTNVITAATISFLEDGAVAENLVDANGEAVTTAADGSFVFTNKDGSTLTTVTATVSAEGFISKSFIMDLTGAEGNVAVQLALTSVEAEGVAVDTVEATVENATTGDAITANAASGKAGADVTVPAGTQLQDADGNPVSGTQISLDVSSADTSSNAAGAIIPEGLNAGSTTTVAQPVGVANVVMTDDQGNKIKKFSSPIQISVAIPASTVLSSGETVKTGDTLSLASHDEVTGQWTNETNVVTVGAQTGDTFAGSFMTDHLTFFAANDVAAVCADTITLATSGDDIPASGLFADIQSTKRSETISITGNSTALSLSGVAATETATVTVRDANGNAWGTTTGNLCGTTNVVLANQQTFVSESFAVTATCANDENVSAALGGAVVSYAQSGKAPAVASETTAGTYALADIVEGQQYTVNVIPRGVTLAAGATTSFTVTADGTDENGNVDVTCSTTTGGN